MRNFLLGLLLVAAIPVTAYAGGGAKPTAFIVVKNTDGSVLAVIVDPPANIPVDLAAFRNAGGKILNTNETARFNLQEGGHVIAAAFVNGNVPGVIGQTNVSVGRGRTAIFTANGNPTFAPVLTRK